MAGGLGYGEPSLVKHWVATCLPFSPKRAHHQVRLPDSDSDTHALGASGAPGRFPHMQLQAPWSKGQWRSPNPEERRPHPHNCTGLPISVFCFIFPFAIKTKPGAEVQEKSG